MFLKFKKENRRDLKVLVFYLLSKNNILIESSVLVFIDDKMLEDRIGDNMFDVDYFIGFK